MCLPTLHENHFKIYSENLMVSGSGILSVRLLNNCPPIFTNNISWRFKENTETLSANIAFKA